MPGKCSSASRSSDEGVIMADAMKVIDKLTQQIAALVRENAVLSAELEELRERLEQTDAD